VIGGWLSGAPREYAHLQNSIRDFPTPPEFRNLMQNLACENNAGNYFEMDPVVHMNFGSVQLYLGKAIQTEIPIPKSTTT
jgi:ubiquinone/menaquinone biosynthesis C-methylase UbiE